MKMKLVREFVGFSLLAVPISAFVAFAGAWTTDQALATWPFLYVLLVCGFLGWMFLRSAGWRGPE